jgi:hypothetical protein
VAEHINRRFFNVIHLLSHSIPIIAVQVTMLTANGKRSLFFTKILDTFEEIDDGEDGKPYTREDWARKANWTVDVADTLVSITRNVFGAPVLNYVKNYVAITVGGSNYMRLHTRILNQKTLLSFRIAQSLQDEAASLLDARNIPYLLKTKWMKITVDREMIEKNAEVFVSIAALVKKSWEGSL